MEQASQTKPAPSCSSRGSCSSTGSWIGHELQRINRTAKDRVRLRGSLYGGVVGSRLYQATIRVRVGKSALPRMWLMWFHVRLDSTTRVAIWAAMSPSPTRHDESQPAELR